jgi:hypothetical protein
VAFVTRNNQLFLLIDGPALIVGIATGWLRLGPWDPLIKTALFIAGPVAAVLAYGIIKPDPGCSYDCIDKLFWGGVLVFAVGAWWLGLVLGVVSRRRRVLRNVSLSNVLRS